MILFSCQSLFAVELKNYWYSQVQELIKQNATCQQVQEKLNTPDIIIKKKGRIEYIYNHSQYAFQKKLTHYNYVGNILSEIEIDKHPIVKQRLIIFFNQKCEINDFLFFTSKQVQ